MNKFFLLFVLFTSISLAQVWQGAYYNNDPIKLSIRDKYGDQQYKAIFHVTDTETNQTYIKEVIVKADNWGTAYFPNDFNTTGILSRKYFEWECQVKGKKILYGSFYYLNFELNFSE